MSSFAGLSVVNSGQICTTLDVGANTDSGYHLLVVKDYAQTVQEIPNGDEIISDCFTVGGYQWYIIYYPNGHDPSCADYISLGLYCLQDQPPVKVKYQFSFVDQVEYQKPMHIRATETCRFSDENLYHGCDKFIKRDALERSTHLNYDCFIIRCDIMICKNPNTQHVTATMCEIGHHLDNLLQNKVGADVTFQVSGEMFAAHRCVLAARSTVFMAQLFGPMQEGTTSSVIQIKDLEPKLFKALLSFIYTDSFPKMDKDYNKEEDEAEVVEEGQEGATEYIMWLHDLFVAADRYDLQRLKLLCEENLSEHIGVSSVASTLALAEQHYCHELKEACLNFIQIQSPKCLDKIMATDGWKQITTTYPSVLNELIVKHAKLASNQKDNKRKW
ncbi:unnamed protein product [Alopecurus aequalis]